MEYVYTPPIQTTGLGFRRAAERGSIIGQQDSEILAKWIFEYPSRFLGMYSVFTISQLLELVFSHFKAVLSLFHNTNCL